MGTFHVNVDKEKGDYGDMMGISPQRGMLEIGGYGIFCGILYLFCLKKSFYDLNYCSYYVKIR
jgi:hypothetical protein